MGQCGMETEVFSRIVGYFRPLRRWNEGKAEEFRQRLTFDHVAAVEPVREKVAIRTGS